MKIEDLKTVLNNQLLGINEKEQVEKVKVENWCNGYRAALRDIYGICVEPQETKKEKKDEESTSI